MRALLGHSRTQAPGGNAGSERSKSGAAEPVRKGGERRRVGFKRADDGGGGAQSWGRGRLASGSDPAQCGQARGVRPGEQFVQRGVDAGAVDFRQAAGGEAQ